MILLQAAWLQVQCFLMASTVHNPDSWQRSARLRALSQAKLTVLAKAEHEQRFAFDSFIMLAMH